MDEMPIAAAANEIATGYMAFSFQVGVAWHKPKAPRAGDFLSFADTRVAQQKDIRGSAASNRHAFSRGFAPPVLLHPVAISNIGDPSSRAVIKLSTTTIHAGSPVRLDSFVLSLP